MRIPRRRLKRKKIPEYCISQSLEYARRSDSTARKRMEIFAVPVQ